MAKDIWRLRQLQSLPLEAKVALSSNRIREWVTKFGQSGVYVSFSGGKDSTALLHLVRSMYDSIPAVFADTGLEYPEIRDFVKTFDNVVWVKPKISFKQVIEKYGWPIISKKTAHKIRGIQISKNEEYKKRLISGTPIERIPYKWQFLKDAPFLVSDACCYHMKHGPIDKYARETGRVPISGVMASEGMARESTYLKEGCNAFNSSLKMSRPMSIWNDDDVWEYIRSRGLKYASVYDTGVSRTGCVFCCFGVHMEKEPNRFQILRKSHPNLWSYCMNKLGLREVLNYIGVKTGDDEEKGQGTLF